MQAHKHVFSSGLRLLTIPVPSLTSATVTVWVNVGSRYETESEAGISHFLEHMVFKGGKKYPTAKAISEAVDAMGAEFNAGTSKDYTNFYIKAQSKLMDRAFEILSDMVLTPKLSPSDIERERGVIIEEMNMYEDTPMYRIGDIFDQLIFQGNTLGRDIIGYKETVGEKIKKADFVKYRDTHYHAKNIVITVAGGVTQKEAISLTEKYFGGVSNGATESKPSVFSTKQTKPQVKLINKKIEQAHVMIGHVGLKMDSKEKYIEDVLSTLLGHGMSSRLFTEVREKRGLCYTVRTNSDNYIDTGSLATYTGTDPKKALEAIRVILSELDSLKNKLKPITKVELQKAKDYLKGHIALSLEDTRNIGSYFGHDELILGKFNSIEEDMNGIDSVTEEQIYSLANKIFKKETLNLSIIGPFEDTKEFEKVLE